MPTVEFDVDIERFFGAQSITELMNYLEDNKGRQYMVNVGAVGIDTRVTKGFSETADIIQQAISHELNSRDLNNPDPQSLRILLRGLPRLTKEMVRPENSFPDKVFQLIRAASSQELHDLVTR